MKPLPYLEIADMAAVIELARVKSTSRQSALQDVVDRNEASERISNLKYVRIILVCTNRTKTLFSRKSDAIG